MAKLILEDFLLPEEKIVWPRNQQSNLRCIRGWKWKPVIYAFVLTVMVSIIFAGIGSALPQLFNIRNDFSFVESVIALIFLGIWAFAFYRSGKKVTRLSYLLTNKRALVIEGNNIIESCSLKHVRVYSNEKQDHSLTSHDSQGNISSTTSHNRGNVVFMENGTVVTAFENVIDPEAIVNIARDIITFLRQNDMEEDESKW